MEKQYITTQLDALHIIGITVRTTNENYQAAQDISTLWQTFLSKNLIKTIPNTLDSNIYSVYTDYEKDHTKPYSVILGCKVKNLDSIPEGMVGISIPQQNYAKFIAKGNLNEGIVFNAWSTIWNSNIQRAYTADFEIYGERAQNPEQAEVDIFIAIK